MEARLQLRKAGTTSTVDSTNYRSIVGSLRYLVNSRSDLAYSVGYVSRFMEASSGCQVHPAQGVERRNSSWSATVIVTW